MKNIVLFGAGKSATVLIDYLSVHCGKYDWSLLIADANIESLKQKIAPHPAVRAIAVRVEDELARAAIVRESDLVISLLPAALHFLIAKDCLTYKKNLLTASYVDDQIRAMAAGVKQNGLLFLAEMGLDPGIDHMSAMQLIDKIHAEGGSIHRFRSHTGGLISPESDDNPWHYKISWNPRNIVRAGSSGAVYRENGKVKTQTYQQLFQHCETVKVAGAGKFAFYPNRDSLMYQPVYGLDDTATFLRTTLRHPDFCKGWKYFVQASLTDDQQPISPAVNSIRQWAAPMMKTIPDGEKAAFDFLGFNEDLPLPPHAKTSADVLQSILETKWEMKPRDKDMIVMLHEISYRVGTSEKSVQSSLIVLGEDRVHTAMAKTVGMPLAIAAILILQGKIKLTGLHIPILREIYDPVLAALAGERIQFLESVS